MALAKAYSSITITDATDVGRISLYITSSLPQTVIENPNEATTVYTPDWSKTHLVLTPIMYFNDQQLTLPKTGLTVTWKRQEGSSAPTDLKTGETVKDGEFSWDNSKWNPYIYCKCTVYRPKHQCNIRDTGSDDLFTV